MIAERAPHESFGKKVSKAIKRKIASHSANLPTQKQHKDQAERNRKRYPGYKRKRTKGE